MFTKSIRRVIIDFIPIVIFNREKEMIRTNSLEYQLIYSIFIIFIPVIVTRMLYVNLITELSFIFYSRGFRVTNFYQKAA